MIPLRLTVITPSFSQARFIRRTIDSVLSQNVGGLEYLVFDACSTDGTSDILRDYAARLTAVVEPDAGQADAVNKGLARATGDVIGWLNSDDVYYPGACRRVLDVFETRADVDVVYGEADHIDEGGRIMASGTPEQVARTDTATGRILKNVLKKARKQSGAPRNRGPWHGKGR